MLVIDNKTLLILNNTADLVLAPLASFIFAVYVETLQWSKLKEQTCPDSDAQTCYLWPHFAVFASL